MSKKVLVVDDEKSVRNAFVLALEDTDCEVDTAANGAEGVEKFAASYDALLDTIRKEQQQVQPA